MDTRNNSTGNPNDEITLKELILKISEWFHYLLSRWKVLLLALLIGSVAGLIYSLVKEETYIAEVTFVLEGDNSSAGSMGMYAGIARQFGLDIGTGNGGSAFSGDNFIALLKSRLLIERTLLTSVDSSAETRSLADYYIDIYDMWEEWDITEDSSRVNLPTTSRESLSLEQSKLLKKLYLKILKEHLIVEPKETSSFITASFTSRNELYAKLFVERLMDEATDFYIQTKTKRSRESIGKLEKKADSLERVLNKQTYAVASSQDLNANPARQVTTVGVEVAARDKQILQGIYAQVMQNLEINKIALLKETPLIQIIDGPVLPLKKDSPNAVISILMGAFIAFFLTTIALLMAFIFKEIMRS